MTKRPAASPDNLAVGAGARISAGRSAPRGRARAPAVMLSVLWMGSLAATLFGLSYYLMGPGERLRSPFHAWLRPSGPLGLTFGIASLALFLFMWLYPLRKRFRWLSFTGAVPAWLDVHIAAGLSLPVTAAVHAGWRFEGLIGLGYLSMVLVAASGVVGRYLYVHIPRSQNGVELGIEEVAARRRTLITEIAAVMGVDPMGVERSLTLQGGRVDLPGPLGTVWRMITDDVSRWKAARTLEHQWRRQSGQAGSDRRLVTHALRLARRELALQQQARMLAATRRVFGLWHVAHRPFAMTALLAVLIHVVVAVAVGAVTWR